MWPSAGCSVHQTAITDAGWGLQAQPPGAVTPSPATRRPARSRQTSIHSPTEPLGAAAPGRPQEARRSGQEEGTVPRFPRGLPSSGVGWGGGQTRTNQLVNRNSRGGTAVGEVTQEGGSLCGGGAQDVPFSQGPPRSGRLPPRGPSPRDRERVAWVGSREGAAPLASRGPLHSTSLLLGCSSRTWGRGSTCPPLPRPAREPAPRYPPPNSPRAGRRTSAGCTHAACPSRTSNACKPLSR